MKNIDTVFPKCFECRPEEKWWKKSPELRTFWIFGRILAPTAKSDILGLPQCVGDWRNGIGPSQILQSYRVRFWIGEIETLKMIRVTRGSWFPTDPQRRLTGCKGYGFRRPPNPFTWQPLITVC